MHQSRSRRLNEECGWKRGTGRRQAGISGRNEKMLAQSGSLMEVDFVAAKAFDFSKPQQLSTSGSQQVQYQSLKNLKFQ
jgi:hypothetical protein